MMLLDEKMFDFPHFSFNTGLNVCINLLARTKRCLKSKVVLSSCIAEGWPGGAWFDLQLALYRA